MYHRRSLTREEAKVFVQCCLPFCRFSVADSTRTLSKAPRSAHVKASRSAIAAACVLVACPVSRVGVWGAGHVTREHWEKRKEGRRIAVFPVSCLCLFLLFADKTCTIIKAKSKIPQDDSEEEAPPASAGGSARRTKAKGACVEVDASGCTDTESVETEALSKKRKKRRQPDGSCSNDDSSAADPAALACVSEALACGGSLLRITMRGGRQSLREHLKAVLPRCCLFHVVGGCGAVDVLLQRGTDRGTLRQKRLHVTHIHGTCNLRDADANWPSLTGLFQPKETTKELKEQYINATFGVDDFVAGGRDVCEIWGFAIDKRGACIAPSS
ncbi:hypothetical protein cyc_01391 [Cyclospora cayetanensis]|nr:hypothetical protein cyc_01391 [Cyclospora cayetanensis]